MIRRRARPRVTIYSRRECGLCRRAEAAVMRVARWRADIDIIDIDADPRITERYTLRVPVVAVDGVEIAEYEVDPAVLRDALRSARRSEGKRRR